jgi:cytosolic carboxypeptidase protein 2/3
MKVKFNIMNYNKGDAMFNYGMKISCYSDKKANEQKVGWHLAGENISYEKNTVRRDASFTRFYYTLTWEYEFEFDNDTVYFSYCLPFTYTDLRNDIMALEND